MKKEIKLTVLLTLFVLAVQGCLYAQDVVPASTNITGVVIDPFGSPIEGVNILNDRGVSVGSTNFDGVFVVETEVKSLTTVMKGYRNVVITNLSGSPLRIQLKRDVQRRDDTIDLGYMSQSRNSVGGAIATVDGLELSKTPSANLSQTLSGRLLGLVTNQTDAHLGAEQIIKLTRGASSLSTGQPIFVIDGLIVQSYNFDYITPAEIESITLLKDASATALYGTQGSNGVLVITTKSGKSGELRISATADMSIMSVGTKPLSLSSYQYAQMRNEGWQNDGSAGNQPFSNNEINQYKSGTNPLYPNNNYYKYFMKDFSTMERIGVTISGGSRRARFMSNVNVMNQGAMFNNDEAQHKYDAAPRRTWINFRTKVDIDISDKLSAFISFAGNLRNDTYAGNYEQNNEMKYYDDTSLYRSLFQLPPTMVGPLTEDGRVTTMTNVDNPTYGMLNKMGYTKHTVMYTSTHGGINLDLDFITKGLSLNGSIAFQTGNDRLQYSTQDYKRYYYNTTSGEYLELGSHVPSSITNSAKGVYQYNVSYMAGMDYKRTFGQHTVQSTAYTYYREEQQNRVVPEYPAIGMPYYRHSLGINALYGYKDTYFIKGDVGYTGSDVFDRKGRYTAVPSISAAWVVSNETFLQSAEWLTYLKLRASYGLSANDDFAVGDYRFLYLDYITTSGDEKLMGNPNLCAETTKTQNYGIDLGLFNELTVSFDLFRKYSNNMLIDAGVLVPSYQGVSTSNFQKVNLGRIRNNGFEIGVNYEKSLNKNISFSVGASLMHTINNVEYNGETIYPVSTETTKGYAYPYRQTGYPIGQQFGYLIDKSNGNGYINNSAELTKYTSMYEKGGVGTPRLGDLIYQDLNGDGIISEMDYAPIGKGSLPENYLTFCGSVNYKGLELSFLFQGVTGYYENVDYFTDTNYNGIYNDLHQSAWTPERYAAGQEIKSPALAYTNVSTSAGSPNQFIIVDRSYVRLKNLSLSYKLPTSWTKYLLVHGVKVVLSGQNLFTLSKLASKSIDPEIGYMDRIPVYRVFNIGLKVDF